MRILYDNNFDDYSATISSEDGNYPGSNIQDSRLSKVWRTTALTSQTATIDSGTGNTLTPTFAALLNTNLSTGATVKIQGSSSTGFESTGSTELSLTRIDSNFIGSFLTLSAKRHWRFLVKDTGSTDSYMSVGRAWLGTYITVVNSVNMNFPEEPIDSSVSAISFSGQQYGDEGVERRSYKVKVPLVNSTNKVVLDTFFSAVKKINNFITIFDSSNMSKIKPLYGYKPKEQVYTHLYNYNWECSFSLEEVK